MINPIRHSQSTSKNAAIEDWTASYKDRPDNMGFLQHAMQAYGNQPRIFIGLIGSRDLPGVTLRRAQSVLRWDMRPSLWSDAFILRPGNSDDSSSETQLIGVPLHARQDEFPKPEKNGVCEAGAHTYATSSRDANVAVLSCEVSEEEHKRFFARIEDPNQDRTRYDFWQTLAVWHSYLWSFGSRPNPLTEGWPIPSASFVEYCFEGIGMDVTPGTSERNSAPEHLWNAALWWHEALNAQERTISGCFVVRDKGCSMISYDEGHLESRVEAKEEIAEESTEEVKKRPRRKKYREEGTEEGLGAGA